jgi:hypothetical protein
MGESVFRGVVSCILLAVVPVSLFSADTNAAMLYTNGAAWINGAHMPRSSSAIFSGDLVQTRSDSIANINQSGSSIRVLSDSLVQFDVTSMKVEHGGVLVSTSRSVAAVAGDVKVTPVSNIWTEFKVTDVDGTVRIAAIKGDVTINDGQQAATLQQGQETTRDESSADNDNPSGKKKNRKRAAGASPGASGGILNSPVAVGVGAAAVGGVLTWVLLNNDDPVSKDKP